MILNDSRELFAPHNRVELINPPIIVTDCLRTPENIGNLIRLAANIGITKIVSIEDIVLKESKIKKTACMAWDYVELIHTNTEEFSNYIPDDYEWVAVETSPESKNIYKVNLPARMAVFMGSEIRGIQPEILSHCPLHVHIPMTGPATSMNVSHAAAVSLFEWVRQNLK